MRCTLSFADEKVKAEWERLNASGNGEDRKLVAMLNRAFDALEKDCRCGVYIRKKQIPKIYIKKYGELSNLWKYNLSNFWRLVYFVTGSGSGSLSVVVEWMNHTEYDRRFGYE